MCLRKCIHNTNDKDDNGCAEQCFLSFESLFFYQESNRTFQNGGGRGDCSEEQQEIEYGTNQLAAGNSHEYACQCSKPEAAAHTGSNTCRKYSGDNHEACKQSNQSVQCTNDSRVGNQVIFIGEVGSVCHHNAHAKGEGEECLPQSGQDCNAVDSGEINLQHVFQTFICTGKGTGTNHQSNQHDEQQGHQKLRHFFDTGCAVADDISR